MVFVHDLFVKERTSWSCMHSTVYLLPYLNIVYEGVQDNVDFKEFSCCAEKQGSDQGDAPLPIA